MGELLNLRDGYHVPAKLARAERNRRILELSIEGHRPRAIAETLAREGHLIAPSHVSNVLRKLLAETGEMTKERAEELREMDLARLDAMLVKLAPMIEEGRLTAMDRAIKIIQQRARLAGIDKAPPEREGGDTYNIFAVDPQALADAEEAYKRRVDAVPGTAEEVPELPPAP
jgi:hypothetical protein